MDAAEDAYTAALAEIEKVRAEGGRSLTLTGERFRALDRIPPEVGRIRGLIALSMAGTQVTDLAPLASLGELLSLLLDNTRVTDITPLDGLLQLEGLALNGTQVTELAPLAKHRSLQVIGLNGTKVTNLAPLARLHTLFGLGLAVTQVTDVVPLAGLRRLRTLVLNSTLVIDLRPIRAMREPKNGEDVGLDFADTPFAIATPETRRLASIEDRAERTRETLAFLKTLPPWPKLLPWDTQPKATLAPPDPDPSVPLVVTDAGIDLAPTGLSAAEIADSLAPVLHAELVERAAELVRLGNRDDAAGRYGDRLASLLAPGLARLDPLRLHLTIEDLRRYDDDARAGLDPEVRRAIAATLEVGPGLTLGSSLVVTFLERVKANQLLRLDAAQVAAQIRLTAGIEAAELAAPTLRQVAALAKDPDRTDQFTAIRPTLTRNYVLENGKVVVGAAMGAVIGHVVTTGHPGWLAAHAADILIAAQGWGAPYVAWIAPILDRSQQMVEAAQQTRAVLRDRSNADP